MLHCVITGNTATTAAGAYFDYWSEAMIDGCIFEGLEATASSALLCLGDASIANSIFRGNAGGPPGGNGSVMKFDNDIVLSMRQCQVLDNHAPNATVIDVRNATATFVECEFARNIGRLGGAVGIAAGATHFAECSFIENIGVQGGAVNLNHSAETSVFAGCRFLSNRARMRGDGSQALGGAIFTLSSAQSVSLEACEFRDNQSEVSGGAIYPSTPQPVDIVGCVFVGNHAVVNGGALRRNNGTTTITGSVFQSNIAGAAGGAAFVLNGSAAVADTFFCHNSPNHISGNWINLGNVILQAHCTIAGDITGDGTVNFDDLLLVMGSWGPCPSMPAGCPADLNGDNAVNMDDLLLVIGNWG